MTLKMSENKLSFKLIIRRIEASDCDEVRGLLTALGFAAAKYDNEVMMKVDPNGIFVAQDLNTGKLIGTCSGVNLSSHLSFFGQLGVREEYRNLGIARKLLTKAMEHMGTDRNVGLYAQGMAHYYRNKWSFKICEEKHKICFAGKVNDLSQLVESIEGISVVPINDENIERVIQYDKEVCDGLDRSFLIQELVKIDEYVNRVAVGLNGDVLGFCFICVSNLNYEIVEPLYANDERIAELLLRNCLKSMAVTNSNGIIYNCLNTNTKAIALAEKLGLSFKNNSSILFTEGVVNGNMDRIYSVSSRAFFPF